MSISRLQRSGWPRLWVENELTRGEEDGWEVYRTTGRGFAYLRIPLWCGRAGWQLLGWWIWLTKSR